MANYYGTTVSEGGKIKEPEKVKEILANWKQIGGDGEMTAEVEGDEIHIYGYDDFNIYDYDAEDGDNDVTDASLKQLCPFIVEPLIIKSVGNEKCRYVGAGAYIVTAEGVYYASLDDAIRAKLNEIKK